MSIPEPFYVRSFRLALSLIRFYRAVLANGLIPEPLLRQLLRAGTSIGANLAEAKSAYSRRELAAKYSIGLKECRECEFWLRLFVAEQPRLADATAPLLDDCGQLIATLTPTIRKLRAAAAIKTVTAILSISALLWSLSGTLS